MTYDLIVKKVEAEMDDSNYFGIYRLYSFLMSLLRDPIRVRATMLRFGYTKTEATRVASRYNYHNNKA